MSYEGIDALPVQLSRGSMTDSAFTQSVARQRSVETSSKNRVTFSL